MVNNSITRKKNGRIIPNPSKGEVERIVGRFKILISPNGEEAETTWKNTRGETVSVSGGLHWVLDQLPYAPIKKTRPRGVKKD
jgi:hypothetical protein